MNLTAYLSMNARKYPQKEALIAGEKRITFQQWHDTANQMAGYLQRLGLGKGDKVILMMPNCPEFAVMHVAVIRCGAIVIPINARSTRQDVVYLLADSDAKGIIVHEMLRPALEEIQNVENGVIMMTTGQGTGNWLGLANGIEELTAEELKALLEIEDELTEDDEVSILYTSGTTGRPKGVLFTQRNLLTVATMMAMEMNIKPESRILQLMPLSHSAPLHLLFVASIIVGAAQVLAPTFSPDLLLELTQTEKATHFFGAPVAYLLTMRHPHFHQYDLSSVTHWIYGGAPLSREMAEQVEKFYGREKLVSVYGLTEAGPSGACLRHARHPEKAGSIGNTGVMFTELEVVDEQDQPVQPGGIGEIRIRGEGSMKAYYKNPEATGETRRNGWIYSGDMARVDEDGFIWIIDRKKEMMITGGVNVFPKEIELELEKHPAIQELAVVGIPHPEWGETIKAFIVLKESELAKADEVDWGQELRQFLQGKIADYKIPRIVECIAALPRNSNGKILKSLLRNGSLS